MPLVRFQMKNEFTLGQPKLYRGAAKEDPKVVLDGVVVAGLVGILCQLGDLTNIRGNNETDEEAAIRKAIEEAGVQGNLMDFVGYYNFKSKTERIQARRFM